LTEFDRVLAKLWENGSQGKPWRLIKEIYRNVQNKVLFKFLRRLCEGTNTM
jgi:hypothetical protein